jgi:hypothetical protein
MKRQFGIIILSLLTYLNVSGQITDFVKVTAYPIHKSNIGKIAFMEQIIALENFKETDFLNSFELKEKSDLNIRVF